LPSRVIGKKPKPAALILGFDDENAERIGSLFSAWQPARRRIQQAVDRRFNRSKYNAAKTIEGFSTRLREQVDLDTLSTELLAVVDQTMQPTTTSLWLRLSARPLSSGRVQVGHPSWRPPAMAVSSAKCR
jgi:hypothetical protein